MENRKCECGKEVYKDIITNECKDGEVKRIVLKPICYECYSEEVN